MNDKNWFTRFIDPLVAFSRGPELLLKGYKMVFLDLDWNLRQVVSYGVL